ncbi:hypothetical protein BRARA_E02360 [Brassica rapa]|uniref:Uncharacterized protein n=1 Tax=Brassica campestris TaxID=3711 RepID=A0A397ZJW5_BRACM|nr:hypothetical protein BRARA_E02360 [Brassica rapa]
MSLLLDILTTLQGPDQDSFYNMSKVSDSFLSLSLGNLLVLACSCFTTVKNTAGTNRVYRVSKLARL